MIGRTLIISGGEIDTHFAREYLEGQDFDTVVCADSGLDGAFQLGLPVHYAMGDFDSVSENVLKKYQEEEIAGVRTQFTGFPPEKDATDTHIVLDWVTRQQPEEIVILGATGRRLDHFLANVNILIQPLQLGIPAYVMDRYNRLYLLCGNHTFRREELFGTYISLLPLTEEVRGVSLKGFRYEVENKILQIGDSIGVSNELAEGQETAFLEMQKGILIVVESRDR